MIIRQLDTKALTAFNYDSGAYCRYTKQFIRCQKTIRWHQDVRTYYDGVDNLALN